MPNYNSSYTGQQIDTAIQKYLAADGNGGIADKNWVNANYLSITNANANYLSIADANANYLQKDPTTNDVLDVGTLIKAKEGNTEVGFVKSDNTALSGKFKAIGLGSNYDNLDLTNTTLFCNGKAKMYGQIEMSVDGAPSLDNIAAYATNTQYVSGSCKITVPYTGHHTVMQMLEVWVYDYGSLAGSIIFISGYTFVDKYWHQMTYKILGNYNRGVRFGYDGTSYCILLGTTATTWSYPQIYVPRWFGGFTERGHMYDVKPTISFVTSESGYTIT